MISQAKLNFWIDNNYNVLIEGKHGVGKTSMVLKTFEEKGLKWLYFSASTMDPWVDFIGVPKEFKDSNGNSYLDLVRPQAFQNDEVEALFFDEYNRSNKKVRNAVMELIQFKSINGKKFNNLRIVWAAINPDKENESEDEGNKVQNYDVERLDPAQEDRFHVKVYLPYRPSLPYFKSKYGTDGERACDWWSELPVVTKNKVSPRRLDYAVDIYTKGGDVRDCIDAGANTSKLITYLKSGSVKKAIQKLFNDKNEAETKKFFKDTSNVIEAESLIFKSEETTDYFLDFIPKEILAKNIVSNRKLRNHLLAKTDWVKENTDFLTDVANTGKKSVHKAIARTIKNLNKTSGKNIKGNTKGIFSNMNKNTVITIKPLPVNLATSVPLLSGTDFQSAREGIVKNMPTGSSVTYYNSRYVTALTNIQTKDIHENLNVWGILNNVIAPACQKNTMATSHMFVDLYPLMHRLLWNLSEAGYGDLEKLVSSCHENLFRFLVSKRNKLFSINVETPTTKFPDTIVIARGTET